MQMMRLLREVNVDANTVGWYQSSYLGSFVSDSLIDIQFNYQESIPHSVCIVYDPLRTAQVWSFLMFSCCSWEGSVFLPSSLY
jgi:translation initiation factor 3 subunit H